VKKGEGLSSCTEKKLGASGTTEGGRSYALSNSGRTPRKVIECYTAVEPTKRKGMVKGWKEKIPYHTRKSGHSLLHRVGETNSQTRVRYMRKGGNPSEG